MNCAYCGSAPEKLFTCSKCQQAKYCSSDCQKKAWPAVSGFLNAKIESSIRHNAVKRKNFKSFQNLQ